MELSALTDAGRWVGGAKGAPAQGFKGILTESGARPVTPEATCLYLCKTRERRGSCQLKCKIRFPNLSARKATP